MKDRLLPAFPNLLWLAFFNILYQENMNLQSESGKTTGIRQIISYFVSCIKVIESRMGVKALIDLWRHRYKKYSHIFKAYFSGNQNIRSFRQFKAQNRGTKLVAVVRTEHFGDIVAVEPLSRHIRSLHPDAHIVWFVKPVFKELVEVNPHIDRVFPELCVTERQVILKSGVFDKIYELQFRNNNYCAECQASYDNPVAVAKNINVDNYFEYGNLLEVFAKVGNLELPEDQHPEVYLQKRHRLKIDELQLPQSFIVIHCQSNFAPKDWPAQNWQALVNWLIGHYSYSIVEVGLKSNLDINHPRYFNLTGKLSILETAEVIRRAHFFIGLDSGPAHLANAVGTYGVILMGTLNDFEIYNPYSGSYGLGQNCTIIRETGKPCSQLSLARVTNSIRDILPSEVTS